MKKHKKIIINVLRFLVMALLIALIFILPTISLCVGEDDMNLIYKNFVGSKSEYKGVIEIWNIDTFESGTASKVSFLKERAKEYQRQNKGLYFLIRNVTEQECINMLKSGQTPDLFSCSVGVADEIKDYLQEFSGSQDVDIFEEFIEAGKRDGKLYGLAWCRGVYTLISTVKQLENAKVDDASKVKLSDVALKLGYKIKNKNSEKTISSLTFGAQKYLLPNNILSSYNSNGQQSVSELELDGEAFAQSQYSAYCNFIAEKSVILLGSQRDVARVENRVKLGKISEVVYEPITSFTDLVQYMFIAKCEDKVKVRYLEGFSKFLTSEPSQQKLSSIGMFFVRNMSICPYKSGIMFDIASEIIGNCKTINVFTPKSEIEKFHKDFNV